MLPQLTFASGTARARFHHNVGVFFGAAGPAADLSRARAAFSAALDHFRAHDDGGWRARTLHNFATALSNLGRTRAELEESVALFEEALGWRTRERAIARGVTTHNMGIVWRRLAELDPDRAPAHLEASAAALREAVSIREAQGLAEGHALSLFHLGLSLEELAGRGDPPSRAAAQEAFRSAAEEFQALGKTDSAAAALHHLRLKSS